MANLNFDALGEAVACSRAVLRAESSSASMSNPRPEEGQTLGELRRSLRNLALPGDATLATFPDTCVKSDELALEFSDALGVARNFRVRFSDSQWASLVKVDELLDLMSGEKNAALWSEQAVLSHPRWEAVRAAARSAMQLMGWDVSL